MSETAGNDPLEALEIRLLLEGIYEYYGYDFRNYAPQTLRRRIQDRVQREKLASVAGLLERVLHDPACLHRLVGDLTISVSTMFRDPTFFAAIREQVIPLLNTYPFIRIWHAGCANGEEVYSTAILLHEAGLLNRCRIYATDLSEEALQRAPSGVFALDKLQDFTRDYLAAGGRAEFSEYYSAGYGHVIFRPWLKKRIVFSRHNLVTDGVFNEFNLILCRNVLIYFNRSLQERVHTLLNDSLKVFGFLGLGRQESLDASPHSARFEAINKSEKLFRKIR